MAYAVNNFLKEVADCAKQYLLSWLKNYVENEASFLAVCCYPLRLLHLGHLRTHSREQFIYKKQRSNCTQCPKHQEIPMETSGMVPKLIIREIFPWGQAAWFQY